jgi:hypothetical protein
LVVLHIFTHLTMGVGFPRNILWLGLFLVFSPLGSRRIRPREVLGDLPVLGRWLR